MKTYLEVISKELRGVAEASLDRYPSGATWSESAGMYLDVFEGRFEKNVEYAHIALVHHMTHFKRCGSKVYEVASDLALLLNATQLRSVSRDLVQLPFGSFLIVLNKGMVSVDGLCIDNISVMEDATDGDRLIRVCCVDSSDAVCSYFNIGLCKDTVEESVEDSIERMRGENKKFRSEELEPVRVEEHRHIFNLVLNCILYITGADCDVVRSTKEDEIRKRLPRLGPSKRKKLEKKLTGHDRYRLGGKIVLSRQERILYQGLSESGTGGSISGRYLVQGHWRNQAHGSGLSKRKLIWIAPFWKGSELSEIVNRRHYVK